MSKITFDHHGDNYYTILKDGREIGTISGASYELWIALKIAGEPRGKTVARFKYASPQTKAKQWCRVVCAKLTNEEVFSLLERMSPRELQEMVEYTTPTVRTEPARPAYDF